MTQVDLITGFLGAGKTTFIKLYARWLKARGVSFKVIENEFGMAGVDTVLLSEDGITASELAGGCICCSLKVDFALLLAELSGKVERIIVEPSGIFSLKEFYDVLQSPVVRQVCEPGAVLTVVDAPAIRDMGDMECLVLASQLHSTGRILLSKTGGMSHEEITAVRDMILDFGDAFGNDAGLNWKHEMGQRMIEKEWPDFTEADFQVLAQSNPLLFDYHNQVLLEHPRLFNSITVYPKKSFSETDLQKAMKDLTEGSCGRILRIKGYCEAADGGSLIVNCTAHRIEINRTGKPNRSVINIIGSGVSRKACEAILSGK